MEKRGSIVANKFVGIALLIAGAMLIIGFFYFIDWEKEISREACHESVIVRGTLPDTFEFKNLPSLNCQTKRICITDKLFGKGDCGYTSSDNPETIRVSSIAEKQDKEINKIFAREMADCWAMMGEGKLQIFTRNTITKKRCSICTIISFDDDLRKKRDVIYGLGDYLMTKQVPGKEQSYALFLKLNRTDLENLNGITTKRKAILFFEVDKSDFLEKGGFVVGGIAGFVLGKFGGKLASVVTTKTLFAIGTLVGYSAGGVVQEKISEADYLSGHSLIDYDEEHLKGLECDSMESLS